jgi:PhzF family phenazine biosynthesis protein
MELKIFQIDAFSGVVFRGNPAAVCPLDTWPEDAVMQNIAAENNLSETAFYIKQDSSFDIRWFTPVAEVDLCGHATLAAAFVIFNHFEYKKEEIRFNSRSGTLRVLREGKLYALDFPAYMPKKCEAPEALQTAFNIKPIDFFLANYYMVLFETETQIRDIKPDLNKLKSLDNGGIIVTAPGDTADFVSRFFAPKFGIDEDPVTGSAHCALTPYWTKILRKENLTAFQLSSRGGVLQCRNEGKRVRVAGEAARYLEGIIQIP